MKLLIGPGLYDPKGNEAHLVKSLKKVADVKTFDHTHRNFKEVIDSLPGGWRPEVILIRDAEFYKMPMSLEEADCPVFALIGDYNLTLNQMLPILGVFDYFFCDTKGVRIFNRLGFYNCDFFCLYGYDKDIHKDYGLEKDIDIVFIGNLNHQVQKKRESLLFRLAKLGRYFRIVIDTDIFGTDYAKLLNRSHLVFNYNIRDEANMRFFEALGCNSIVINRHIDELDLLGFMPDIHYLNGDNLEESVCRYFLQWSKEKRESMKEAIEEILPFHSYDRRAEDLIDKIEKIIKDGLPKREFMDLPDTEKTERWRRYLSNEIEMQGIGKVHVFHPKMLEWQRYMVDKELAIENLDFSMWRWWIELLKISGLYGPLLEFLMEREMILENFGCYKEMLRFIRDEINLLLRLGN